MYTIKRGKNEGHENVHDHRVSIWYSMILNRL